MNGVLRVLHYFAEMQTNFHGIFSTLNVKVTRFARVFLTILKTMWEQLLMLLRKALTFVKST